MIRFGFIAAATIFSALADAASASTVLEDYFDYGTVDHLNLVDGQLGTNWSVTPTLDYLGTAGAYTGLCRGTGGCVDLDGSSAHAGVLTSTMNFAAGTYDLAIQLFGNFRGYGPDDVTITLGSYTITIPGITSGQDVSQTLHFTTNGGALSFSNAGGDNVGAILSGVKLAAVPLPASGLLLLGGLGLAALRRRKPI